MMTATDETARILAEHGDAQKIAGYAIYGVHQAYREAREAAEAPWIAAGRPAGPVWDETARKINAAAAERRRALTGILLAYDVSKPAGQDDNYEISTARGYLTPLPAFLGSVA